MKCPICDFEFNVKMMGAEHIVKIHPKQAELIIHDVLDMVASITNWGV